MNILTENINKEIKGYVHGPPAHEQSLLRPREVIAMSQNPEVNTTPFPLDAEGYPSRKGRYNAAEKAAARAYIEQLLTHNPTARLAQIRDSLMKKYNLATATTYLWLRQWNISGTARKAGSAGKQQARSQSHLGQGNSHDRDVVPDHNPGIQPLPRTKGRCRPQRLDLSGQTFQHLTVERLLGRNDLRQRVWLCRCVCGQRVQRTTSNVRHSVSCGCLHRRRKHEPTREEPSQAPGQVACDVPAGSISNCTQFSSSPPLRSHT